jgi:DNA-binding beta-propeller fold protein YncE
MKLISRFLITSSAAFVLCGCYAQSNSVKLISTISLTGVNGRIDHMAYNSRKQALYIAALGNNSIEVVDLKTSAVIHSIKDLSEPQGLVYISGSNTLFVSNSSNGECIAFNAETFQQVASVKLSGDADNVRFDSTTNKIYVGYGNGGIAIIDALNFTLISKIELAGHPESFQIDKGANKIFVNVPGKQLIEIIDLNKNLVTERWKITEAKANFPMCLDEANHRLFIGCRHPAKLLIINTESGKTITTLPIDGDVNDIFYNKIRSEIYLSCGAGFINIIKQESPDIYKEKGKIPSDGGARTSLFIPDRNQLIVASPSDFNSDAAVIVFEIK